MNWPLELAAWALAIAAIAGATFARHRMASLTDAVARTCHELRGPLTAAQLALVLAGRDGQLADIRRRALELELGRATLAVEDLSQLFSVGRWPAIVRAGTDQVDVAQLLAELVEAWRGLASAAGAELRLAPSRGRPVLTGERLRIAQAVGNLVANAVEHGGGVVELGWQVDAAAVRLEVVDQGPGLPASLSELARRRRRRAGSRRGHGLAVASAIAAAHGGRLVAASGERGARLALELPLRAGARS